MNKTGPHAIHTTDAVRRWATVAPIVKGLDNVGILQSAPATAIRVFRHYFANQNLDDAIGTARAILTALGGYNHHNLYVELWNEVHPTPAQMRAVVDILHGHGLKVAGGSYGTGDYSSLDLYDVRAAGCDAVAIHCYWGEHGFSPWHALRYRSYGTTLPILITECGRDAVEGGQAGWIKCGLTAQEYYAELVAYDAEISQDSGVLGATPFTGGPTHDWNAFDTDPIVPFILAGHPVPPEVIVPKPALDPAKIYEFSQWQKAAADNLITTGQGSDPRDSAAFTAHLKALGADFNHPTDYGYPFPKA